MKVYSSSGFLINGGNTTQYGVRTYSKTISYSNTSANTIMTLTAASGASTNFTITLWADWFATCMLSGATYTSAPQENYYTASYTLNSSAQFVENFNSNVWGFGTSFQSLSTNYNGTYRTIYFQATGLSATYYPFTSTFRAMIACSDWSLLTVS